MKSRKARKADERITALVNRFAPGSEGTNKTLRVTLIHSEIGGTERQRATLRCLGLGRRGSHALVADTPQARGRIRAVAHLVEVEEAS